MSTPDRGRRLRNGFYLITAGVLLPVIAVAVMVWGVTNRADSLDDVPVAIVNNDHIVTGKNTMAAGRALTAALTHPSSSESTTLDWTLTSASDAEAGLKDGEYYSVLTIPSDFSHAVVSSGTATPAQAQLTLQSNEASSMTAGLISTEVADAAAQALGTQVTQGFLDDVFVGFDQESTSLADAASHARTLADGTATLSTGASQLGSGSQQLAASLGQLSSGASSLAGSTGDIASSATTVASGSRSLADGTATLSKDASSLASNAAAAATAAGALSGSAVTLATSANQADRGADSLASGLQQLDASCPAASHSAVFCAQLNTLAGDAKNVAGGTGDVGNGAATLASSTQGLASGTSSLATAVGKLASGASSADTSAGDLASGAARLSAGATAANQGAGRLSSGLDRAATAAESAASGSSSLASSAASVDHGAHSLSSALGSGAKKAPSYSKGQQKRLSTVVSQPVVLRTTSLNDTIDDGWLIAAITGLTLWLGALATMFLSTRLSSLAERLVPVSSRRLLVVQVAPRLALALAQAVVVLIALLCFQQQLTSAAAFAGLTLLGALVFALIAEALQLTLRRSGTIVFLLLLVLQLAAIGNVLPLQTAPHVLQTLNGLLPLTAFINGAGQFASGGEVFSVAALIVTLVVWGLVALAVAAIMVRRGRIVRAARLGLEREIMSV